MGIKHETTPPHSPQSNGKAERLNRTLNNQVCAMLYQANMPNSFWAEAMSTAAYVNNLLPSESINFDIPYERWFNKPLSKDELKVLKPFGCIVEIGIPEQQQKQHRRSKFNPRSTRACFVGYLSRTLGALVVTKTRVAEATNSNKRKLFM